MHDVELVSGPRERRPINFSRREKLNLQPFTCRLPQGLALSSLLFNLYMKSLKLSANMECNIISVHPG